MRSNTAEADALVRRLLSAHVVDDEVFEPNYSLLLASSQGDAKTRPLHLLYRGSVCVARSEDPRRVLHALLGHLSGYAELTRGSLTALRATTLVLDDRAVVGPVQLRERFGPAVLDRALARAELRVADGFLSFIDIQTAEVVVPELALDVDWAPFEHIPSGRKPASTPAAPGRYDIAGWALFRRRQDDETPLSRAIALCAALEQVVEPYHFDGPSLLDGLAAAVRDRRIVALPWWDLDGAVQALSGAFAT